ncbi:MAG: SDR family oxidoreductase [Halobacteriovoraceae bacterium]|nr:SDR family oxidoreductase [Halobacteriovoraceae bacterium]MCB9094012.1 SDR family oxidoreductase [Halobacteriovoraceae bacterium]
MKIFFTGASGFIGKELIHKFVNEVEKIFVLVRASSVNKMADLLKQYPDKIELIVGELESENLSVVLKDLERLKEEVTDVIHMAALYDLTAGTYYSYLYNVIGTQNLVELSSQFKNLKNFHYISSYVVNNGEKHTCSEEELSRDIKKEDPYTWSKNRAEWYIRNNCKGSYKVRIYRPGIVIGDSNEKQKIKKDGPYYFIELIKKWRPFINKQPLIRKIPICYSKKGELPFIPINYLVSWLSEMILHPMGDEVIKTYHVFGEPMKTVNFLRICRDNLKITKPFLRVPMKQSMFKRIMKKLDVPGELSNYFVSETKYSRKNLLNDYPLLSKYQNIEIEKSLFGDVK